MTYTTAKMASIMVWCCHRLQRLIIASITASLSALTNGSLSTPLIASHKSREGVADRTNYLSGWGSSSTQRCISLGAGVQTADYTILVGGCGLKYGAACARRIS